MAKTILYESQELFGFMTDFYKDEEGDFYMTRRQLAQCLGYVDDDGIRRIHERYKKSLEKHSRYIFVKVPRYKNTENVMGTICPRQSNEPNNDEGLQVLDYQRKKTYLYDEEGIYFIAMKSDQPIALEFTMRVAEVLKQLRKGYQVWLLAREKGKEARRTLTDAIRDNIPDSSHKKFAYKNYTDLVYKLVTGKNAKQLKQQYGEPLRDKLPCDLIQHLEKMEGAVKALTELGYNYEQIKGMLAPKLEDKNEL